MANWTNDTNVQMHFANHNQYNLFTSHLPVSTALDHDCITQGLTWIPGPPQHFQTGHPENKKAPMTKLE